MSLSNAFALMQKDVARRNTNVKDLTRQYVGPIVAFTDGSYGQREAECKGGYSVVFPDHLVSTLRGP
jgi:hypothetical protein